jgi:hypothetical protein
MAIPQWCGRRDRTVHLRPAPALCAGESNLLFLFAQIPFCTRSSLFAFSDNSGLRRMLHIPIIWNFSHSLQYTPWRARTLCLFWPGYNHFCRPQFGGAAVSVSRSPIFSRYFLHRQSGGNSNTLPGCCPKSRGSWGRLLAC